MTNAAEDRLQLDQFLKLMGIVDSGGQAKHLIKSGIVTVNSELETRRGRKLKVGDVVEIESSRWVVETF